MIKLTIRKAYKTSCELKERSTNAKNAIAISAKYEVFNAMGQLSEVVRDLHATQITELERQLEATRLVAKIRQRIQEANNKPLHYADGKTINTLIAEQATLKALVAFYPEEKDIVVTNQLDLTLTAQRTRATLEDATNHYRSSTNPNLSVTGTSQELKDRLSAERLALRVELEAVTGKLAYANITETVELAEEEAEILRSFRIPV